MRESKTPKYNKPSSADTFQMSANNDRRSNTELSERLAELQKANEQIRHSRRAALNLMEDAIASKEALRRTEETYRLRLEKEVQEQTAQLKESREQYASLVENTPDVITRWNKDLKLLFANSAFVGKTGIGLQAMYGKTNLEIGQPEHVAVPYMNSLQKAFETGEAVEHFNAYPTPNGEAYFYSRIVPEKNEEGEIVSVLAIARDITSIKKTEKELADRTAELKRSNEDLRQFAHVASHDLKEPVRKIKTFYSQLMKEFGNDFPVDATHYLGKIKNATDRMASMIEGVLHYSKVESDALPFEEIVDLNTIIKQIQSDLEVLILQKNAVITINELPVIQASNVLIYQLFYNLLLNSLKFAKKDIPSSINIEAEKMHINENDFYRIGVSDNGIGFEPEFSEEIFKTFTRLNGRDQYEGTGLGLALCKKIVERHKGSITAAGEPGKGAILTILLPADYEVIQTDEKYLIE